MAGKMIITELDGNAIIFAPDGSVRAAELYAELKPEEVLVTENGSQALLKENGEREIRVNANSGFRFETPPDADAAINALQRDVEEGEDPTENADPAAGQSTSTSSFFVAGDVSIQNGASSGKTVSELLEESQDEQADDVESLTADILSSPQLGSLSTLQRLFYERLLEAQNEETTVAATPAPETPIQTETTEVNEAPTVSLSMQAVTEEAVSEGQAVANINAVDANNDSLSYALVGDGEGYFRIEGNQVVLTQAGVDAVNSDTLSLTAMQVEVEVSDGEFTVRASGQLVVNQVNDNVPDITLATIPLTENAVEEGMVVATFSGSDADGNTLTYTLSDNDDGYLALGDGEITLTRAGFEAIENDALAIESLEIYLTATDGLFEVSASDIVVVTRVNDNSPAVDITTSDVSETSAAVGQIVAVVAVSDADGDEVTLELLNNDDNYFALSDGNVTLTAAGVTAIQDDSLDITNLTVTVRASDGTNTSETSAAFIVGRENDNTPEISLALETLTEEAVTEQTLVATVTVSDADGDDITLSLVNDDNGYFRLEGNEVYLTAEGVAAINLDGVSAIKDMPLYVRAFDGAYNVVEYADVSVTRVNDNAPEISLALSDLTEQDVAENDVLATIISHDADLDTLTYTLTSEHGDWIKIVGNEVQLTAAGVAAINDDVAELSSISFTVKASDTVHEVTADGDVTVTRVNDNAPDVVISANTLTEESVSTATVVATVMVTDADENGTSVSLTNNSDGYFVLSGDQVLLTEAGVAAVNNDLLALSTLSLSVSATDGVYTTSASETINITRVEDISAADDAAVTATLSVASGNVISGSNGAGEDSILSVETLRVETVTHNGIDYDVPSSGVTIETDFGSLTLSQSGNYQYTSSVQTEFYASNLTTFEQTSDGVTFFGNDRSDALFISDDPGAGLDLEAMLNPSGAEVPAGNTSDDVLNGTNQGDTLYGYGGNDTLSGNNGEDLLYGGEGNDSLDGGNGKDYLSGGEGDDTLTGGNSKDVFVYESGDDVITDFKTANETIVIKNATNIDTFAELALVQDGADTVITLDNGTLTLENVDKDDLTAAMFTFDTDAGSITYHATVYGFEQDVDSATLALDGISTGETVDWYVYDSAGTVVDSGSSTYDGSELSVSASGAFQYLVVDKEGVTVDSVFASLSAVSVLDEVFTYTLTDDAGNSAQADLTLSYNDLLRPVADVVTVQTAGLGSEVADTHMAMGNLFTNDALSGEWTFAAIQYDGATYNASEGTILIETPYGSLTVYGQDDGVHNKGDFTYHLMIDLPAADLLESFSYTLENASGLQVESRLDIRLEDNNDASLSDLINDTELTGDDFANTLVGFSEDDVIVGEGGNDSLYGNAGADLIDGGLGNDLIVGGQGSDTLTGGQGEDLFSFLSGDAGVGTIDTLTDFDVSSDVLDLSDLLDGATAENLDDYLVSLTNTDGNATLTIASDGVTEDQVIVFENKTLDDLSVELLGVSGGSGAEILGRMIEDGALIAHS